MNKRTPYETPFRGKARAAAPGAFAFALSAMMLVQGLALATPVAAQTNRARALTPAPAAAAQHAAGQYTPEQRQIIVGLPINVRNAAAQRDFAPSNAKPSEIKPHNIPMGRQVPKSDVPLQPDEAGPQAGGEVGGPLAPVPSTTGQSPPPAYGFRSNDLGPNGGPIPPDTMGAVGPNHVVTTTNQDFVVQNRKGQTLVTMGIEDFITAAPITGYTHINETDPKIYYDRFNDRWMFSIVTNTFAPTAATLVFVSQTGDPTGTWNRYAIDTDAAATATGGEWADYPSMGFNKNWIVVTVNRFGFGTVGGFRGPSVYVINKAAAYANTLSTVSVFEAQNSTCTAPAAAKLGCGFTMSAAVTEDNTTETEYMAEDWFDTNGQLRLSKITGTAAAPVLTVGTQFPQSPYSWRFDATIIGTSGGYVLQRQQNIYAISGNRPTANDSRLGAAPVLRNGTLWATHHVMLGLAPSPAGTTIGTPANPDVRTAVQWWEIDPTVEPSPPLNAGTGLGTSPVQFGRIEDPTADNCHNGAGGLRTAASVPPCAAPQGWFYTFPAIAVNQNDDVLIGYSRFSNLTLPKAGYSVRLGTDPVNTMRDTQTYREGVGNYQIGGGTPFQIRWGDYSAAMVDPTNDTDFWNIQEFADFQTEIFGPGSFGGTWGTWWSVTKPTATTTTAGNLIISEFRLRGPAGVRDEFIELYNPASTPLTVTTTDGSDGWAVAYSSNGTSVTALASIPNGTTIPARGHVLVTNEVAAAGIAPYSLRAYANTHPPGTAAAQVVRQSDADVMYTPDLADNGGVAIFRTANPANMNAGTRMDSVGFAGIAAGFFKEGAGIPNITGGPTGQISFHRRQLANGTLQDTGANENDFVFTDTVIETLGVQPTLGAPGPQNLDSPVQNGNVFVDRFDMSAAVGAPPNRVRRLCADPLVEECNPARSALGTISMRRRVTNYTGAPVSRLRWRIIQTSTNPTTPGVADLRAITSSDIVVNGQTVKGTVLEETPVPVQALGGGWNSSWSATLPSPLAPGDFINVQFLMGVQVGGTFSVLVYSEVLP